MLRRFSQLLVLLLPLGVFALALPLVQQRLFGGQATSGILLLLVGLALLALAEGLLFRYWILPGWGDKMAERLYAGSYLPEQDELALLLERVAREKSVDDLPLVEKMVRRQPRRLRGWLELAHLQQELLQDDRAALRTCEVALTHIRDREDAALLLYRAAQLCEKKLHDTAAAARFYERAATQFADTVYGRRAASRVL